jgi:hypothetical protein
VIKLLGSRGASAVTALLLFALGASAAPAQTVPVKFDLKQAAGAAAAVDASATPLGTAVTAVAKALPAVASTTAVTLGNGTVVQAQPAQSVTLKLASSVAAEAAWLRNAGWPLYALVDRFGTGAELDAEANCVAVAVYHEARGESVEGQLAVARVIMNRAASGKYPSSWCATVKQPWQFSFVNPRSGQFPYTDTNCAAWRKAVGVTRLAMADAFPSVGRDVLW